jgi:hypothetical protein
MKRDLKQLDGKLQKLHREHPVIFNLIAASIALILFGFILLLIRGDR